MQAPANALFHRHLVLAYTFTWTLQLAYLGYVLSKHFIQKGREEHAHPSATGPAHPNR